MSIVRTTKNEHIDIFFVYGLGVCSVLILSIIGNILEYTEKHTATPSPKVIEQNVGTVFHKEAFSSVKIEGKAFVVYDIVNNEVIASKNESEVLPLASITKVMTAVSATLHKDASKKIVISPQDIEGAYDLGLRNNQSWELSELLKYVLIFSSNDGALAIADAFGGKDIFIKQMNDDARVLGINAYFTDPAGRDVGNEIGGKGTALDAARLFSLARKLIPEILDATTKKRQTVISSSGRISGVPNTNQYIEGLSGAEGSKTGFTDLAGGNLGVIVDVAVGHPVVIVVLGSTREGRFRDVSALYKALRVSVASNQQQQ